MRCDFHFIMGANMFSCTSVFQRSILVDLQIFATILICLSFMLYSNKVESKDDSSQQKTKYDNLIPVTSYDIPDYLNFVPVLLSQETEERFAAPPAKRPSKSWKTHEDLPVTSYDFPPR
jgi:hypothetical protein